MIWDVTPGRTGWRYNGFQVASFESDDGVLNVEMIMLHWPEVFRFNVGELTEAILYRGRQTDPGFSDYNPRPQVTADDFRDIEEVIECFPPYGDFVCVGETSVRL